MKIFMIGGTGLLGCEAATELIKRGHSVTSVALPPLPEGAPIPAEMEIIFGDINKKSDAEIEALIQKRTEARQWVSLCDRNLTNLFKSHKILALCWK